LGEELNEEIVALQSRPLLRMVPQLQLITMALGRIHDSQYDTCRYSFTMEAENSMDISDEEERGIPGLPLQGFQHMYGDYDDQMEQEASSGSAYGIDGVPTSPLGISEGSSSRKRRHQVARACLACASAHVKCQDERPCPRCVSHGLECIEKPRVKAKRSKTLLSRTTQQ
jgi:hypothetical protein